ncbi:defective in cullin neddylation protein AAR3-like [Bidens hawaiensis]|uniref:defective in cullin neddylation protein AAR3-like n=1 Tax=Bidens hawaiensis TaxID=980011 RepID=UPI00404A7567
MDASFVPGRVDIFQIYTRYCEVTSEALSFGGDGYRPANESNKAKLCKDALSNLLQLIESSVDKRMPIFEQIPMLMSRLDLMADSCEFSRFYNFIFFISRENGQRSIAVSRAIMAWKLVLSGRFRLLNQWCNFVEKNQRHNISEDTWRQVLAFSRCVHENLEGYDPEGAWPVLVDEFVEHMYRVNGYEDTRNVCCSCSDSKTQPIDDSLPGLKIIPGVKRKYSNDLQNQELTNNNNTIIMHSKRRHTDLANPCAIEGSLSEGIQELFSSLSSLQFDRETRV